MGLFILTKTPGPLDIWMERENEKGEREKEEWEEADGIYSPKPSVIQSVPHDLKQKLILYQRIPQGYHMIGSINLAFITLSWKKFFLKIFIWWLYIPVRCMLGFVRVWLFFRQYHAL